MSVWTCSPWSARADTLFFKVRADVSVWMFTGVWESECVSTRMHQRVCSEVWEKHMSWSGFWWALFFTTEQKPDLRQQPSFWEHSESNFAPNVRKAVMRTSWTTGGPVWGWAPERVFKTPLLLSIFMSHNNLQHQLHSHISHTLMYQPTQHTHTLMCEMFQWVGCCLFFLVFTC